MPRNTMARNIAVSAAMTAIEVENTQCGFSSSLLAKRKKVVSIPNVSSTSISATYAYRLVTMP